MTDWILPETLGAIPLVVLTTFGMYATILALARFSGVRSFAQMSTFDIAVTIAIGSLMATTVAAKTPPLAQGVTAVVTLFAFQLCVSRLRSLLRPVRDITDNAPILLMGPGGRMLHRNMRVARVTEDDLRTHLRMANVADLSRVDAVVMEGTGGINVLSGHGAQLPSDSWILEDVRNYEAATD